MNLKRFDIYCFAYLFPFPLLTTLLNTTLFTASSKTTEYNARNFIRIIRCFRFGGGGAKYEKKKTKFFFFDSFRSRFDRIIIQKDDSSHQQFQSKKKKHQHNNQSERRRFRGSGFRQRPHETSRFLHRRAWVVSPSSRFSQRVWRIRGGHRIRSHDCHFGVLFARIRGDWFAWFLVRVDFRRRERVHVLASDAVFERDCERGGEWFYR